MKLLNTTKLLILLLVLLLDTRSVYAEEKATKLLDAKESLKMLQDKIEWESTQLKRLAERVLIPAGDFSMGYIDGLEDEKPVHKVYVDAFYMDKYEVTQLQYVTIIGSNPSYYRKCLLCPVEKVTFFEAEAYCKKLAKRLPTEAEWEKAAKGGKEGIFYWEDDDPEYYAWTGNNSNHRTHPVGEMEPNAYGLHDMAGNVWEWVQDWYDSRYYNHSPLKNPRGPETGEKRVVRGAAWGHLPELLRHTYRESFEPKTRYINGGFRCASDS
jgi:formylglycine-generating enzyme required for sulfatase activity